MKGDFSRQTFRPENHYTGVLLQQGRVLLDADWNEQTQILAYQQQKMSAAFIGQNGAPKAQPGFKISVVPGNPSDFLVGKGQMFVGGLLCELEQDTSYLQQPQLFQPPALSTYSGDGDYLVYLDVWTRHLTVLEDPRLREQALSGADTTTRAQTVWQVKVLKLQSGAITDGTVTLDPALYVGKRDLRMAARAASSQAKAPSILPAGSGYRRLSNQLYRVEIHGGGKRTQGQATYKWSRDNGAIAALWTKQDGSVLWISNPGRDESLGFAVGCWVELTDDEHEQKGLPGALCRVMHIEGPRLTIAAEGATVQRPADSLNPKVRRWDGRGTLPATDNAWLDLEDGIQVRFDGTDAQSGDYFLIPARVESGNIEWPQRNGQPAPVPPLGVDHQYCALAVLRRQGTTFTAVSDQRLIFPPLADLRRVDPDRINSYQTKHDHSGGEQGPQIPRSGIADKAIDASKIADSAIDRSKIADNAIDRSKIADNAIDHSKIADNAIDGSKIANGSVDRSKIADNAIDRSKIVNDAIVESKIADNAIVSSKIADNAIVASKIAGNAITPEKLATQGDFKLPTLTVGLEETKNANHETVKQACGKLILGKTHNDNHLRNGALAIGDISNDFGGNTNEWASDNVAGLLMHCKHKTEIAVHDWGTRLASLLFYEGGTDKNQITLGRTMDNGYSNKTKVIIADQLDVGSDLQTGGKTRIDKDGNLTNIGNLTSSGNITAAQFLDTNGPIAPVGSILAFPVLNSIKGPIDYGAYKALNPDLKESDQDRNTQHAFKGSSGNYVTLSFEDWDPRRLREDWWTYRMLAHREGNIINFPMIGIIEDWDWSGNITIHQLRPPGWLRCNGAKIPEGKQYDTLKKLIGDTLPNITGSLPGPNTTTVSVQYIIKY